MEISYLGYGSQGDARSNKGIGSSAHLGAFLLSETMGPFFGIVLVVLSLPDCWAGDFLGEVREWSDLVVERGLLAGGLQAIGEDIERDCRLLGSGGLRSRNVVGNGGHCDGWLMEEKRVKYRREGLRSGV